MVLTALAVSNVFLYTPQVIKRTILAIGLKKRFPALLVQKPEGKKGAQKRGLNPMISKAVG